MCVYSFVIANMILELLHSFNIFFKFMKKNDLMKH